MFFLITHASIGKYYPKILTQIIVACICYILLFLILTDIIDGHINGYYLIPLILIDIGFLYYYTQHKKKTTRIVVSKQNVQYQPDQSVMDVKSNSIHSNTLSSEINNFKIIHDNNTSENNENMFSESEKDVSKTDGSDTNTTISLFSISTKSEKTI